MTEEILIYCPNCGWRFSLPVQYKGECPSCFISIDMSTDEEGKYVIKVK